MNPTPRRRPTARPLPRLRSATARALLLAALLSSASCGSDGTDGTAERPNVVFILIDTLRAGNLSFMGYDRPTSPHLDALARRSTVFTQAISVGGNTPSAMAGIMTGRQPFFIWEEPWRSPSFGMQRFYTEPDEWGFPLQLDTLAEHLRSSGYRTMGVITNPNVKKEFNADQGFDTYAELFNDGWPRYGLGEQVSDAALAFLRETEATDAPFFLYLHYMDVHGPYTPPEPFRSQFARHGDGDDRADWMRFSRRRNLDASDGPALRGRMVDRYDGSIAYVDASIQRVLESLAASGLSDDTLVVVTSDHGEEFFEHGSNTHRGTLYEEIVHVPLLVHRPGQREAVRVDDLVRTFDLMPTVLRAAGIDPEPLGLDAVDLTPLLDDPGRSLRLAAYANFPRRRMLRTRRHKLLHVAESGHELYDLVEDPGEQDNLFDRANRRTLTRLESVLDSIVDDLKRLTPDRVPGADQLSDETREQLEALGYLN